MTLTWKESKYYTHTQTHFLYRNHNWIFSPRFPTIISIKNVHFDEEKSVSIHNSIFLAQPITERWSVTATGIVKQSLEASGAPATRLERRWVENRAVVEGEGGTGAKLANDTCGHARIRRTEAANGRRWCGLRTRRGKRWKQREGERPGSLVVASVAGIARYTALYLVPLVSFSCLVTTSASFLLLFSFVFLTRRKFENEFEWSCVDRDPSISRIIGEFGVEKSRTMVSTEFWEVGEVATSWKKRVIVFIYR